jgi:hypothetical protein
MIRKGQLSEENIPAYKQTAIAVHFGLANFSIAFRRLRNNESIDDLEDTEEIAYLKQWLASCINNMAKEVRP